MPRSRLVTRMITETADDTLVDFLGRELIGSRIWFAPGQCFSRRTIEEPWEVDPAVRDWVLRTTAEILDGFNEYTTLRRNLDMWNRNREILIRLRDWQRLTRVSWPEDLPVPGALESRP